MTSSRTPGEAGGYDFLKDPWGQAVLTGALTLIPARNYPRWLQSALVWMPLAAGAFGGGYLAADPKALPQLGERLARHAGSTGTDGAAGQPAEEAMVDRYVAMTRATQQLVLLTDRDQRTWR